MEEFLVKLEDDGDGRTGNPGDDDREADEEAEDPRSRHFLGIAVFEVRLLVDRFRFFFFHFGQKDKARRAACLVSLF